MKRYVQELIYAFVFVAFAFVALSRYHPHLWIAACALAMAVVLIFAKLLFIMHHDIHRVMRRIDRDRKRGGESAPSASVLPD